MKSFAVDELLNSKNEPYFKEVDCAIPTMGDWDLCVQVKAISINPLDTKRRALDQVIQSAHVPRILGWDASGIVKSIGAKVSLFNVGDEVYYAGEITRQGSYAEFQVVDERIVGHKPKSLTFERSAALALTSITAWEGLFERLRIPAAHLSSELSSQHHHLVQKSILIIGGAGGVGSMAIQLAKKVARLNVIATASRPQSVEWCQRMGADHVIDHTLDLVAQVRAMGLKHVDHVFILNDTDQHFAASCELIAPQGLICSIVPNQNALNMDVLRSKSAGFVWESMFVRSKDHTPDMIEQHHLLNEVSRLIDLGVLKNTTTKVYSPIDANHLRLAHLDLQSHRAIGKIVLEGFG